MPCYTKNNSKYVFALKNYFSIIFSLKQQAKVKAQKYIKKLAKKGPVKLNIDFESKQVLHLKLSMNIPKSIRSRP